MTPQDREESAKAMVGLIRSDREVHEALLDWAAFNPYVEFKR